MKQMETKVVKPRKLTKKQRIFSKRYAIEENGVAAAIKAYDIRDYSSAHSIAGENLRKPAIIKEIERVKLSLAERIPDELLEKVHLEGLTATRISTSFTEADKVLPDYATRHKYLESAYKLKGSFAPEKHVNVNLNDVQQLEDAIKKQIDQFSPDK